MRAFVALLLFLVCVAPATAGTWGQGQFDNDQALDTSSTWAESGSPESIRGALTFAISAKYLDSDDAVNALVAAEVVAACLGQPNKDLPADLTAWILRQPADQLCALTPVALAAVARVRNPDTSELYELWADQGAGQWLAELDNLSSRLHETAPLRSL